MRLSRRPWTDGRRANSDLALCRLWTRTPSHATSSALFSQLNSFPCEESARIKRGCRPSTFSLVRCSPGRPDRWSLRGWDGWERRTREREREEGGEAIWSAEQEEKLLHPSIHFVLRAQAAAAASGKEIWMFYGLERAAIAIVSEPPLLQPNCVTD